MKKGRISAALLVELPGIETDALPGNMAPDLPVRSISDQFSPARYLRFRFRALTASRVITPSRQQLDPASVFAVSRSWPRFAVAADEVRPTGIIAT
jgi:hypothetical protein